MHSVSLLISPLPDLRVKTQYFQGSRKLVIGYESVGSSSGRTNAEVQALNLAPFCHSALKPILGGHVVPQEPSAVHCPIPPK